MISPPLSILCNLICQNFCMMRITGWISNDVINPLILVGSGPYATSTLPFNIYIYIYIVFTTFISGNLCVLGVQLPIITSRQGILYIHYESFRSVCVFLAPCIYCFFSLFEICRVAFSSSKICISLISWWPDKRRGERERRIRMVSWARRDQRETHEEVCSSPLSPPHSFLSLAPTSLYYSFIHPHSPYFCFTLQISATSATAPFFCSTGKPLSLHLFLCLLHVFDH